MSDLDRIAREAAAECVAYRKYLLGSTRFAALTDIIRRALEEAVAELRGVAQGQQELLTACNHAAAECGWVFAPGCVPPWTYLRAERDRLAAEVEKMRPIYEQRHPLPGQGGS